MKVENVNVTSIIKAVLAFLRGRWYLEQDKRHLASSERSDNARQDGPFFQDGLLTHLDAEKLRHEIYGGPTLP